ncbi:hypothetical protein [Thalassolituus sp.]|jgi:hypothetical protein|uniref:hypothetical protein n=1 Tax=Thalassolituus sp. TaxID=2030822 RepID=UPI002621FF37|nr:hypothetical protein [uncultured Thalassolituus sp.]TNC87996.1 MAG: hypothetical protein CSH36_13835 [Thalassolituus sp.]
MTHRSIISRIRRFYRLPEHHPDIEWTQTETYRRRLEQVKTGWIISGVTMLAVENLAAVLGIVMFTSFMSFAFLERDSE